MKAKVIIKPDKKQPILKNSQTRYKMDCIVADESASMKLVLWEDTIEQVHAGKSYHFQNLKVRVFDDEKFVNTNESTTITEIEDIVNINLRALELNDNLITGQCLGIDMKKTSACIACNNTVDKIQDDETYTCPKCNMTILCSCLKPKLVCQVLVKSEGKLFSYTCFNNAVESFLKTSNNETSISEISVDDLKRLMLCAGERKMIVDKSARLIVQFLPIETAV